MAKKEDSRKGTELCVVLLGCRRAGKTSVVNTILGSNEVLKVTGQCVRREGNINGKKVTLIDTPGWWNDYSLRDSSELTKLQLVQSLSLCSSGPHAVLLVVEVNLTFTEMHLNCLVQHVELLGDKVWDHTIVIFTKEDLLKNVTVDQHIQSGGEPLKRLLEKCGSRCHVLNNTNKGNDTQITELFIKIEDLTTQNYHNKSQIDTKSVKEAQEMWEVVQSKAKDRQSRVRKERVKIKNKANVHQRKELRVVLLGWVMSGKSSAGNTILNREAFKTGNRTTACQRQYGNVAGRQMIVLDTAGWWKFIPSELNPEWVKSTGFEGVSQCKKIPHAFLLVLPIDTSFKEEQRRIIEENMAIFGEHIWRHTIVLFTWGDLLGDVMIEQHIEHESELQWLIEKCGNRYHVFDNTKKNNRSQVTELLEKIEEMVAANSLYRFNTLGVPETRETKPEVPLDTCGEEIIQEALGFVLMEWNKRAMKFREEIEKLIEDKEPTQFKSNRSHSVPPSLSSEDKSADADERQQKFSYKVSENIIKQVTSVLDREWGRHEVIVMENARAILSREYTETSSGVCEEEMQMSVDKVLWWFPRTEDGESSSS